MIRLTDTAPRTIARAFFDARQYIRPDGAMMLRYFGGEYFWWRGATGIYQPKPKEHLRAELYEFMDGLEVDTDKGVAIYCPNKRRVDDVLDAIGGLTTAMVDRMPAWLDINRPHASDVIAFPNGLLSVQRWLNDPTIPLIPPTPLWFSVNGLPFHFQRNAPAPSEWLAFLAEIFETPAEIDLLQQWFGYVLSGDTSQQKILLLCGPPRSGKGTIGRVLTALLGEGNITAPTLANMTGPFGLWGWMNKLLAIISDARLGGRTDGAIVTERLLTISGEDSVMVDRKNLPPLTLRLPTRIVILVNELPKLDDSSGALAERFLILHLTKSFLGREDPGLTARLCSELPDILLWALDGLRSLRAAGRFTVPQNSADIADELRDLVSPIRAFVRDCCHVAPGSTVPVQRMFEAWTTWCEDHGRKAPGTVQVFGRDLRAALPAVRQVQPRTDDGKRERAYEGVTLTASHAEHTAARMTEKAARHAMARGLSYSPSREGGSYV